MKGKIMAIRLLFAALFLVLLRLDKLMLWLVIYLASLMVPLLLGKRVYCMAVCPINTLMLGVVALQKKLNIPTRPMPKWLKSGKWAYLALGVTAALFVISRKVLGRTLPVMILWLVAALLLTLRYHPDVFHDLLCPYGVLQRQLSKLSLLSEAGRAEARSYQGFTASVLGGNKKGRGAKTPADAAESA